jgi:tetratricopeptide (TPR) repeat protein
MKVFPAALLLALFPCMAMAREPQHAICSPPPPRSSSPLLESDFAGVRTDLLNGNRQQALSEAEGILDAHPGNAEASFMIGTLLLDYGKPDEALVCFRNAQAAWPGSTDVHAGLLEAYAETGDRKDRDIERAILRGYHSDGRHPSAARTSGIVIERFHAGDKTIEAVEYFAPQGPDHVWYRFTVGDDKGVILGSYAFAADDQDQAAYRQQHPDIVGSTLHRFALESFFAGTEATLGDIDGAPSYDDFRTRIVSVVQSQNSTASAAAAPPKHK